MSAYCIECGGQGIIWAKQKAVEGEDECLGMFIFRCNCSWCNVDSRSYPRWNSGYAKRYVIDKKAGGAEPKALPPEPKSIPMLPSSTLKPYAPKHNLPAFNDDDDDLF